MEATAAKLTSFLRLIRADISMQSDQDLGLAIERFFKYVILVLEQRSLNSEPSGPLFPPPDVELVWITCMLHPYDYARSYMVCRGFSTVCFLRELLTHHNLTFLDPPATHEQEIRQTEMLLQKSHRGNSSHSVSAKIKPSDVRATLAWSAGFDTWLRDYTTELRHLSSSSVIVPVCTRENPVKKIRYRGPKRHLRDPKNMELTPELLRTAVKEYEMFLYGSYNSVQKVASSVSLHWKNNTPPSSVFGRRRRGDEPPAQISEDSEPSPSPSPRSSPKLKLPKLKADAPLSSLAKSPLFEEHLEDADSDRNEYHRDMNYLVVPVPVRTPDEELPKSPRYGSTIEVRPCYLADLMWHCTIS